MAPTSPALTGLSPNIPGMGNEDEEFWIGYRLTERSLRERCNRLVSPPLTSTEWTEAMLMDMDGLDATDAELKAYWRLHRFVVEHDDDAMEFPDLRYVMDALDLGKDPVVVYQEWLAEMDNE